jgi:hypothetical protein
VSSKTEAKYEKGNKIVPKKTDCTLREAQAKKPQKTSRKKKTEKTKTIPY